MNSSRPPVPGIANADLLSAGARVHAIRTPADLFAVARLVLPVPFLPIGRHLVAAGAVSEAELAQAESMQPMLPGRKLEWILTMLGALQAADLEHVIAERLCVPRVALDAYSPVVDVGRRVPAATATRIGFALLHEEPRQAWIAVADVADPAVREAASFLLARPLVVVHASGEAILGYNNRQEPEREGGKDAGAAPPAKPGPRVMPADSLDFVNFGLA